METPKEVNNYGIYFLAFCASMGSAMFGYDSAFIGGAIVLPSFQSRFGLSQMTGSSLAALKANTVSTFQAGCFFGAIFCYLGTEKFGRKVALIVCGFIFDVGVVLQLASSGMIGLVYTGRAVTGLAVGASSLIVPVYIAECSPPAIRGRLIGIFEVMLQLFQVIGFWINYAVNKDQPTDSDSQWQIPFGFQLVPGTLLMLCMLLQPESPRWLMKSGRNDKAAAVLSRIRNLPETHPYIIYEMQMVNSQISHEQGLRSSQHSKGAFATLHKMFVVGNRERIFLGVSIMLFQNLVGANAINYYSPSIFASLGFTGTSISLLATGIYGIIKFIATSIFVGLIVDKVGRRKPLLIGSVGIFAAMLYLGIYTKLSGSFDHHAKKDGAAYLAIVLIYFFAICFCFSWNSVAWIFCAEIFPIAIRSACLVLTTCAQWLGQFIIVYSTPYMMRNIGFGTFIFFACATSVAFVYVWFLIPETAGLPLEDMDAVFAAKGPARHKRRQAEAILSGRAAGEVASTHHDGIELVEKKEANHIQASLG